MCGIVGYIGDKQATDILIGGLQKLEYRGYDSAGIAVFGEEGVRIEKAKGRLKNLEDLLVKNGAPDGRMGIGHTRWATHGEPSDINSHPHVCGRVTLVHNGIIENYISLKQSLIALGHIFVSQTDTEVVAHLIDHYYDGTNPMDAIIRAIGRIRGSYALAIMFSDVKDRLFAVRRDSPLIIGIGQGENYIASDVPAILNRTRDYYLINEQEIAVISASDIRIFDFEKLDITAKKQVNTATWDVEAAEKCGYPHFMLKEIHEQPKSLAAAIEPHFVNGLDGVLREEFPEPLTSIKRLIIVACGSAMHTGLLGKYAIEKLARVPVDVTIASEFRYSNPILGEGDAVLIISQSGETADSLAALRLAKSKGVPVYAIVNVVGSSIAREADKTVYIWAGPEIAVATTKAFTSQTAVLYLLALRLACDRGTVTRERAEEIGRNMRALPDVIREVLADVEKYQHLASFNQNKHDLFYIGRGQDYALCCEGSLKLKEISYMHSEAYAAGELKHGTISLITEGTPCVAVATERALVEKTISNIKEVKARGAQVTYVCARGAEELGEADFYDFVIELPATDELLMPIVSIVPLQVYAYYTAVYKGCDVDKPRNLAKSVTVE